MKTNRDAIGFILLTIGTAGLLLNEILLDLGIVPVLVFSICNLSGLFLVVKVLTRK